MKVIHHDEVQLIHHCRNEVSCFRTFCIPDTFVENKLLLSIILYRFGLSYFVSLELGIFINFIIEVRNIERKAFSIVFWLALLIYLAGNYKNSGEQQASPFLN